MMSDELQQKILKLLYHRWFENFQLSFTHDYIVEQFPQEQENSIKICIEDLRKSKFIAPPSIQTTRHSSLITKKGIKHYESKNPEEKKKNGEEREKVLKYLETVYIKDVEKSTIKEELISQFNNTDNNHVLAQMVYLRDCGLLNLNLGSSQWFSTKLTSEGHGFVHDINDIF